MTLAEAWAETERRAVPRAVRDLALAYNMETLRESIRRASRDGAILMLPRSARVEWLTLPTWAHRSTDPGARP